MVCRLVRLDTIMNVPVFRLQQDKSVLKPSRIGLQNCLQYVSISILKDHLISLKRFEVQLILAIQTKCFGLFLQMENKEPEMPEGPVISLMSYLNLRPEVILASQFVEVNIFISSTFQYQILDQVVVLGSYVNIRQEDKGFCKIFVAAKYYDTVHFYNLILNCQGK